MHRCGVGQGPSDDQVSISLKNSSIKSGRLVVRTFAWWGLVLYIENLEWVYLLGANIIMGECGISGKSGVNFGGFTPHLIIVNHGVINFLVDGIARNLLSVYFLSMNLDEFCFPLDELIFSLGSFFFILSWTTPIDDDSFFGYPSKPIRLNKGQLDKQVLHVYD